MRMMDYDKGLYWRMNGDKDGDCRWWWWWMIMTMMHGECDDYCWIGEFVVMEDKNEYRYECDDVESDYNEQISSLWKV